jgi:hypothetical protein
MVWRVRRAAGWRDGQARKHAVGASCSLPSLHRVFGLTGALVQVRALSAMLLARMQRQVDTERVAAFSKRLSGVRSQL